MYESFLVRTVRYSIIYQKRHHVLLQKIYWFSARKDSVVAAPAFEHLYEFTYVHSATVFDFYFISCVKKWAFSPFQDSESPPTDIIQERKLTFWMSC